MFRAFTVALMLSAGAGAVTAATVPLSCQAGTGGNASTYNLAPAFAVACFSGNDTNTITSSFSAFNRTGWLLADKNDDTAQGSPLFFTDAPVNGTRAGDFTISNLLRHQDVFITLKSGGGFAAFLLSSSGLASLTGNWWSTKNLSHASIYYRNSPLPPPVSPVPLPASAWMLLAALGGIGAVAGRKRLAV